MKEPKRPLVGDSVHYRSRGSADGVFPPVCRAAIVTRVEGVYVVDITVFNPTGLFFDVNVTNEGYDEWMPGAWHWPEHCHDPRES